ncbi:PREDICTED: uncharacterized protein LOC108966454 [Bactrocera latifrons]|uniref:Uncharacterized protein n=1 Tax=Bactrocera latifrons TaxID=174628 RepID=A0A0K8V1K1_BACLA|nr:PREDICTED: uncharacterized protein LOC108966454 [Bactrocera latifrons]
MRRRKLNSLRISLVVLGFLLCFKARATALTLGNAELRQQTQPQPFEARSARQQQPQGGRQHDARGSQPFNALLTSVGQLADSPLRHGGHLALTTSKAGSRKRLARSADDGGMNFGDIFQAIIQFVVTSIDAFLKLFATKAGDEEK